MKNYYFISDAHLGSRAISHQRTRERRLVRFLDSIKDHAEAVYLVGDMFDFWFEYGEVVPRGHTRFLGKISELTDMGVEVHFLQGNHDMWCLDYLEKECGVILHREALTTEICGKTFYIAHGNDVQYHHYDFKTRLMFDCFRSHTLRRLVSMIHPHIFINFGLNWARRSHQRHLEHGEPPYQGADKESLVVFARDYLHTHPSVDYFVFGHRHIDLDIFLDDTRTRLVMLGEWFSLFTYAVFDGTNLYVDHYIEGETQP